MGAVKREIERVEEMPLGAVEFWDGVPGEVLRVTASADPDGPYWEVDHITSTTGAVSGRHVFTDAIEVLGHLWAH